MKNKKKQYKISLPKSSLPADNLLLSIYYIAIYYDSIIFKGVDLTLISEEWQKSYLHGRYKHWFFFQHLFYLNVQIMVDGWNVFPTAGLLAHSQSAGLWHTGYLFLCAVAIDCIDTAFLNNIIMSKLDFPKD